MCMVLHICRLWLACSAVFHIALFWLWWPFWDCLGQGGTSWVNKFCTFLCSDWIPPVKPFQLCCPLSALWDSWVCSSAFNVQSANTLPALLAHFSSGVLISSTCSSLAFLFFFLCVYLQGIIFLLSLHKDKLNKPGFSRCLYPQQPFLFPMLS